MERSKYLLILMFVSCTYGLDYSMYRTNNITYKIYTKHVKWDSAAAACASEGLELFYPIDQTEVKIARKLLREIELKFIFVGITSKNSYGVFKTTDGKNMSDVYAKWGAGEPNNGGGEEQCVVLRDDGTYNDDKCSHVFPFICRTPQFLKANDNRNVSIGGQSKDIFFRNDYRYFVHTKSFYKVHLVPSKWESARRKCIMEGASLFYPKDETEVIRYLNETQPWFQYMFIGISTRLASGVYKTVDGHSIRNVYNKWYRKAPSGDNGRNSCVAMSREGFLNDIKCSEERPYVCKKTAASLEWNKDCNVPYKDYEFNANTGNCYKFHLKRMNCRDAIEACDDEQADLAIINTIEEANYLINISKNSLKENVRGWHLCPSVHLGFSYDSTQDEWKTIKGETLEEAGYAVWDNYQLEGEEERCGSMLYNGRLNEVSCEGVKCFFICERENKYRSDFNVTSDFRK